MNLDELRKEVSSGAIDTVLLAITDMQGRLMGKRLVAQRFVDEVAHHGAEGCNYLLAVDVDMTPVSGFEMASWEAISLAPVLYTACSSALPSRSP